MYVSSNNFTIKEIFDFGINFLKSYNIESPEINVELLLSEILNLTRIEIRLKCNEIISPYHKQQLIEAFKDRTTHKPLQYIIGKVKFYNAVLKINESVLIPRPETEELTKIIINEIHSRPNKIHNILDIGTGSGCISIALANEFPNIKIDAIDISESAINCANENKNNLKIKNISFINIDFTDFQSIKKYDIIISNPPYISLNDYNKLDIELFFEPKIALTDENDGLTFYKMILEKSNKLLAQDGKIFLECGINQAQKISSIFNAKQYETQIIKDFANIDRFIVVSHIQF